MIWMSDIHSRRRQDGSIELVDRGPRLLSWLLKRRDWGAPLVCSDHHRARRSSRHRYEQKHLRRDAQRPITAAASLHQLRVPPPLCCRPQNRWGPRMRSDHDATLAVVASPTFSASGLSQITNQSGTPTIMLPPPKPVGPPSYAATTTQHSQ